MDWDIIVIGAGIAGASAAYELAAEARVLLLEREDQPGYHSTGRSAALYEEHYGNRTIRALTRSSRAFFDAPPDGFASAPLLGPRGVLLIGNAQQADAFSDNFKELESDGALVPVSIERATELFPLLDPAQTAVAYYNARAMDMDVHAIHQGYLRGLKARGGTIRLAAGIDRIEPGWTVHAGSESWQAPVLVDAAGAWADNVAAMAGARPRGIQPKRRTAMLVEFEGAPDTSKWPSVIDLSESFYVKPDGGKLMLSPADATPVEACDVQPEEIDIAIAVDRLETTTRAKVRRITHRWAGLRSFAPDNTPVVGFDPDAPGFFWLAGQGGYGIQTSPSMARTAAALALHGPIPADIAAAGVTEEALSPARF